MVSRKAGAAFLLLLAALAAAGCGGGAGGGATDPTDPTDPTGPTDPDAVTSLRSLISTLGLTGDPSRGLEQARPAEVPLVNLGMQLFFSRTLSGQMDTSCATCHTPDLGGGDGLSLSVGIGAVNPEVIGLGRVMDPDRDLSSRKDGGPNMSRNSMTTFNAGLWSRALLFDGRVFVLGDGDTTGGTGQLIRTPESSNNADPDSGNALLEAMMRFPMMNNDEMRGFMYPELVDPKAYRERILDRLRGLEDQSYMRVNGAANWHAMFEQVFGPATGGESPITMMRVQQALAAYLRSQIFIDNHWKRFVEGDTAALSEQAIAGARLFLTPLEQGGLGCAGCHQGDLFSDQKFHNVGFPQVGRGLRNNGADFGRGELPIDGRGAQDDHAFRTPSLLNIEVTGPYGHAGAFAELEHVIRYHANPRAEVDSFPFDYSHLPQAQGVDGRVLYPNSEPRTRELLEAESFASAEARLPRRALTDTEVAQLAAFLRSLTDQCVADSTCRNQWSPQPEQDPDGNMLIPGQPFVRGPEPNASGYPAYVDLTFPAVTPRAGFADMQGCSANLGAANDNLPRFRNVAADRNADVWQIFAPTTWIGDDFASPRFIMPTMISGGLAASYLNDDCWPDLVVSAGWLGTRLLSNRGGQSGFDNTLLNGDVETGRVASIGVADINGNFRREVVLGNLHDGNTLIFSRDNDNKHQPAAALPIDRNTFGIAFGDPFGSGYPGIYLAHWGEPGIPGRAPVFWKNESGTRLSVGDRSVGLGESDIDQSFNFSPAFIDADDDGDQDLLVASDFRTTFIAQNDGSGSFELVTDRQVITDEFGMGSAVADVDNDLKPDWFVTSVGSVEPGTGGDVCTDWSGNRLYRNISVPGEVLFEDVTSAAGVGEGGWGWGACAADFNNDGWVDLFHVNGFNELPTTIIDLFQGRSLIEGLCLGFSNSKPKLFTNNGDGTFTDSSTDWGLNEAIDGRSLSCFDYDRDGDVDVAALNLSRRMHLLENQTGNQASRHFINVRLQGLAPNTEALGARVLVSADLDGNGEIGPNETQLRISAANSNYGSQNTPDLHFGLGQGEVVSQLRVIWPDGTTELVCEDVAVNQFVVFRQQDGSGAGICP